MPYPRTISDKILVQIDKKYQDEIVTESGVKFYKDASFNPEWNVTVTGKVVAVPKRISKTDPFKARLHAEVMPGDELFFSYAVVETKEVRKDGESFTEQTLDNATNRVWTNGKQQTLHMKLLTRRIAVAMWSEKNGDIKEGYQGTPDECERWLTQNFKFDQDGDMVYKNLLLTDEGEFWMVDYLEVIAIKRKGVVIMLNGYVLCEPQSEENEFKIGEDGILFNAPKKPDGALKVLATGRPIKGEPDLCIYPGDMIKANQTHVQQYELWYGKYSLVDQRSIVGKL